MCTENVILKGRYGTNDSGQSDLVVADHDQIMKASTKSLNVLQLAIDSRTLEQMVSKEQYETNVKEIPENEIRLGNRNNIAAGVVGTLELLSNMDESLELKNVLLVCTLRANLVFISRLCKEGYGVVFTRADGK